MCNYYRYTDTWQLSRQKAFQDKNKQTYNIDNFITKNNCDYYY